MNFNGAAGKYRGSESNREGSAPSSCRADQAIGYEAEPEVDQSPEIDVKAVMPRDRRQRRQKHEVDDIAQHDCHQGLGQICEH